MLGRISIESGSKQRNRSIALIPQSPCGAIGDLGRNDKTVRYVAGGRGCMNISGTRLGKTLAITAGTLLLLSGCASNEPSAQPAGEALERLVGEPASTSEAPGETDPGESTDSPPSSEARTEEPAPTETVPAVVDPSQIPPPTPHPTPKKPNLRSRQRHLQRLKRGPSPKILAR